MFSLSLIGNIGADAVKKQVGDSFVTEFNVAVNKHHIGSDGQKVEQTEWVRVHNWTHKDSKLVDYLKKGKKVFVQGEPKASSFVNKEGVTQNVLEVIAKEIELL